VTNSTLTISQCHPSDSGQYYVVVGNPLGGSTSANATVTITADTASPRVAQAAALATPNAPPNPAGPSPYLVKVLFDERIDPNTAITFTMSGGVTVNSYTLHQDARAALVGGDWREAIIYTTGLTPGQQYTVSVSGAKDQAQTPNTMTATNLSFRAPLRSRGLVAWDYYYYGTSTAGNPITDLTASLIYPNAPMTNWSSSSFDSTPITGGDLAGQGFGSAGENYGCSLSGWVTPTVSGNYRFFLASDDSSELWFGADPLTALLIAQETDCCDGFLEPGDAATSEPQALVAGVSYFIRALMAEGGGGDYVKVAWRLEGDATPAANLAPIPSQFLSSYAPGPIRFNPLVVSGGQLTISWTGTATLQHSTDLINWTPVPGNPVSPYVVTPGTDKEC